MCLLHQTIILNHDKIIELNYIQQLKHIENVYIGRDIFFILQEKENVSG